MTKKILTGDEAFKYTLSAPPVEKLRDFWAWYCSDLLSNITRGVLAEFIVSMAMGITYANARDDWAEYDIISNDGIRIEVKCSAYLQSWEQKGRLSKITFDCSPSIGYNEEFGKYNDSEYVRRSGVYVFCVYTCKDRDKSNPLNLDLWDFYVLPTKLLDEKLGSQKTVGLIRIQALAGEKAVKFHEKDQVVHTAYS